ncbi:MAG: nicotinate-nucleotide pyrophosphorylase (carboxylating), partial [Arenicella sp.]
MSHFLPDPQPLPNNKVIKRLVKNCLREDIGSGDVTARLTPRKAQVDGKIISREHGVICGVAWVNEVFRQVGKRHRTKIDISWHVKDGEMVEPNQTLCRFEGLAHPILSGERSALNIMQTLSGTATVTRQYADAIAHTKARLLDTRKT